MSVQELHYEILTLRELEDAISGFRRDDNTRVPSRLLSPKLHYYMQPSVLIPGRYDKYLFLMATAALTPDEQKECWSDQPEKVRKPVGLLELEWSPYEENVVWLKYVTVDPAWQSQGVARKLVRNMVTVLANKQCRLDRSRPSEQGLSRIKAYIDEVLNDAGIHWTQSEAL